MISRNTRIQTIRLAALIALLSLWQLPFGNGHQLYAQTVAVRSNALLWGAEAANLSVDLTVNECSTVGITGIFSFHDSWIRHANLKGAQIEYRYWFAHQPFHRLFVGPIVGIFHYSVEDDHEMQTCVPAGINVGYAWALSSHWNVEACYGVGYLYYNRASRDAFDAVSKSDHHKFTTINLGLNLSYVF